MSHFRLFHLIVLHSLWLFCMPPALAQQTPVITVTKGHADTAIDDKLSTVQKLQDTPGGTDLVDEVKWQGKRADNVKDIVDYSPGVFAQSRNGAESSRLSVRGSGLTRAFQGRGLLIMQDGIPINTADGGFDFPVIDPWLIQYAAILRGANSFDEGTSNLGGAINFITPTGLTQQNYRMRAEIGSFGNKHALLSKGYQNGPVDAYAASTLYAQSGFRDHNSQLTSRFNGNVGWQTNAHLTQRLSISQTDSDPEIPGAVSKATIHIDPRRANANNINGDFQRNLDITRLAHRLAWEDGSQRIESTLYYTYRNLWNPVTTFIKENNNDVGWRGRYRHRFGQDHLTLGLNAAYGTADENRYANAAGNLGTPILNRNMNATMLEAYGEYEHSIANRLFAVAGTQFSYAQRTVDQTTPTPATQQTDYTGANPRIGLRYEIDAKTQVFTNLSRSFEPPTLDELSGGNAPGFHRLKAQRATTAEIGTRAQKGSTVFDAAYYYSWLNNEFVNYDFGNGTTDTINAHKSIHEGVELGATSLLTHDLWATQDKVEWRNAFTWNHFRLKDDPLYNNNQLPGVPEYYLRSEIGYTHPSGFSIRPNIEYVPQGYPVDLTNSLKTDSYFLYGVAAAWHHPSRDLEFYVEGRNLADRHYATTTNVVPNANGTDGNYFYPGEGRSIYTGVKIAF